MNKYAKKSPKEMISWRSSHTERLNKIIESQCLLHGKDIVKATLLDHILELGMSQFEANEKAVAKVKQEAKPKARRFNFKQELINLGANADDAQLYMDVRKQKKAVNSEQAFKMFVDGLGHFTVAQAVSICAGEQWKGFKVSWANNLNPEQKKRYSFMEMARGDHLESIPQPKQLTNDIDYAAQFDALRIEDNGAK